MCDGKECDNICHEHFINNRKEQYDALKCDTCTMFHHME